MMIAILIIEIVLLIWIAIYGNYIIKSISKSVDESLVELMNIMLRIGDVRQKVEEAFEKGESEVDLSEVLK